MTADADARGVSDLQHEFERDGLPMAQGATWATDVELVPDEPHAVIVRYEGVAPVVLGGPTIRGALVPLPALPASSVDGVREVTLRPTQVAARIELRARGGACHLRSLVVRRWGTHSQANPDAGSAPARTPERLHAFRDFRDALRLKPGEPLTLSVVLPANATRLAFEMLVDPSLPPSARVGQGQTLQVEVSGDGDGARQLLERAVPSDRSRWQPVRMDITSLAGRAVCCTFRTQGASEDVPDLALSLPEVWCETGRRRPNLVLVSLDTVRPDRLGPYGCERATTPRLTAFAREAAVFQQARSPAPYTLPAHASLFSGQFPSTHGVEHPAHALDPGRTPLLAALLRAEGYATRAFTGGGYLAAEYGFAHGFAGYGCVDPMLDLDRPGLEPLKQTRAGRLSLRAMRAQGWGAALAWIEDHRELPFFLFLHTFVVHNYAPTGVHAGLFSQPHEGPRVVALRSLGRQLEQPYSADERAQLRDRYDEALHLADARIGELLDTLRRLGLEQDTWVVITSDHGEMTGDPPRRGSALVGHEVGLWEELLRVPLLVRGPGVAARRVSEPVSLVSLAPTLLDVMGVDVPSAMQGRSLRPLLEGAPGAERAGPILAEVHSARAQAVSLQVGTLKIVQADPAARVSFPEHEALRLHDLASDPTERRSLHALQPARAQQLLRALNELRAGLREARQAAPRRARPDAETLRQLEQLGYVDG